MGYVGVAPADFGRRRGAAQSRRVRSPAFRDADRFLGARPERNRNGNEVGQQERGALASQGSPILKVRLFALIATAPLFGAAIAGPSDYVFLPAVSYGEREIDFKYGAAGKKNDPTEQAASLGVGYGLKEWWFTEFYVKGAREGAHSNFDAIELENKFQLTETGKYGVDVGFITEFELPHDRS